MTCFQCLINILNFTIKYSMFQFINLYMSPLVLLLLLFANKCRSTTDDMTFILSEDALNTKILMPYLTMLNEKFTKYQFSNGTHDANDIHIEWDNIKFELFKYRQAYLKLDSDKQKIRFKVTNLSIITNIFQVRIKYGMINCISHSQLLIKNWNFSFDIDLYSSNYQIYDNDTIHMIDFQDCELQLSFDTSSVILEQENNDTQNSFDYKFENFMCDIMLNEKYITKVFNGYVDYILQERLPYSITVHLQRTIKKFESKTQDLQLKVGHEISTLIICYHNLSISEDKQLIMGTQLRSIDTISYDDNNEDLDTIAEPKDFAIGSNSVVILILFHILVSVISLFVIIGIIWFIHCLYQTRKNKTIAFET